MLKEVLKLLIKLLKIVVDTDPEVWDKWATRVGKLSECAAKAAERYLRRIDAWFEEMFPPMIRDMNWRLRVTEPLYLCIVTALFVGMISVTLQMSVARPSAAMTGSGPWWAYLVAVAMYFASILGMKYFFKEAKASWAMSWAAWLWLS